MNLRIRSQASLGRVDEEAHLTIRRARLWLHIAVSLCALLAGAIGHSGGMGWPASAADVSVTIVDNAFMPSRQTVQVGDSVTWTHAGSAPHTTTSTSGLWDSGTMVRGASFSFTLTTPGTYPYVCRFHEAQGMRGEIVVLAAMATPTPVPTATPTVTATLQPLATPTSAPIPTATAAPAPPPARELWLVVLAPTQTYSVTDEPLWEAQAGEWYRVLGQENGWALAVWEGDPPESSVWIELDARVQLTAI